MDYKDLTDAQKARARACETPDEILALAREEGWELTDQELEGVAGGWSTCGEYTGPLPSHK